MSREPDISYRPRGRIGSVKVGAHPSRALGSLGTFRDQVPFMMHPDARRIDVRATLRDPFQNTFVRRFQQRSAIDVWMLADVSGSLGYEGVGRKKDLIVALGAALARSVTRLGDRFGLYACDGTIRDESTVPPSKRGGIAADVVQRLESVTCTGASSAGLLAAAERLAGARRMVFLVSDFLFPFDLMRAIFERLAQHDIVPVVIADSSEESMLPDWGLVEVADLETGSKRLVFMRPKLRERWLASRKERRDRIDGLAREYGRTPVTITDHFDVDLFSRQLLEA